MSKKEKTILWGALAATMGLAVVAMQGYSEVAPTGAPVLVADEVTVVVRASRGCDEPIFRDGFVIFTCGSEFDRSIVVRAPSGATRVTRVAANP